MTGPVDSKRDAGEPRCRMKAGGSPGQRPGGVRSFIQPAREISQGRSFEESIFGVPVCNSLPCMGFIFGFHRYANCFALRKCLGGSEPWKEMTLW